MAWSQITASVLQAQDLTCGGAEMQPQQEKTLCRSIAATCRLMCTKPCSLCMNSSQTGNLSSVDKGAKHRIVMRVYMFSYRPWLQNSIMHFSLFRLLWPRQRCVSMQVIWRLVKIFWSNPLWILAPEMSNDSQKRTSCNRLNLLASAQQAKMCKEHWSATMMLKNKMITFLVVFIHALLWICTEHFFF